MGRHGTLVWTLVVFFGATLLFRALRTATEDSSTAVTLLVQVGALAILIGLAILVVRKLR